MYLKYFQLKKFSNYFYFSFRWDYLDLYRDRTGRELEGFAQFAAGGVRAEWLKSVFPAESFPAWQTIQTGNNHERIEMPAKLWLKNKTVFTGKYIHKP